MVEFIMLVGVPGSGKTTYAQGIAQLKEAQVLSSDSLRKEMFGDVQEFTRNQELFTELNRRTIELLKNGMNVIYDATNTSSKRRQELLKTLPNNVWKECHYLSTDITKCIMNDFMRKERTVGIEVINNMRNCLQIPMFFEGWDNILVINETKFDENQKVSFKGLHKTMLERQLTLEEYACLLLDLKSVDLMSVPQDSPYHTLSVGRHCYETYRYIYENYNGDDKEVMMLAGLLHDMGKPITKRFSEDSKYATYKNHDNVSAQIALQCLNAIGYPKALQVAEIVQLHMRPSWRNTIEAKTANDVLLKLTGQELFDKLIFFRKADISAK